MSDIQIDLEAQITFLVDLLNIPSPTGYHAEAADFVAAAFAALGVPELAITRTLKGAVLIKWPGTGEAAPVGLTAHLDTLGFMVKEVKRNGRLALTNLGGILWNGVEGEGVTVRTADDRRIRGTILPENTSVHVNRKIKTVERGEQTMEVRLDARTESRLETEALGIGVGDFVFVDPRVEVGEAGFIRSRFLDDKAGVANIYGAVQAIAAAGLKPPRDVYLLIANYEEVGHGGSAGFPPELVEVLSVDMGALGEGQAGDEFSASICAKDSGGPYHFDMINKLRRLADANQIRYRVDIYPYYSSDGTAYWRAGGEARVGLAGPGVDASHAYERTHREALLNSTKLLAHYMLDKD
ncbi:MAG: M42 family metallopeptidase [Chloroflexota bacterium]